MRSAGDLSRGEHSAIVEVQYLRGMAALLVLLHHVAFKLSRIQGNPLEWLHAADIGVDVFFVISGFVMTHSVRRRHGTPGVVSLFLRGRFARILPLYWLLTLVANVAFVATPSLVNSGGGTTHIAASYLLTPVDGKYLIQNGWTLSYEFYFYFLFSIGLLLPREAGRAIVVAALVLLAMLGGLVSRDATWPRFLFDPIVLEFAAGMAIYELYERGVTIGAAGRWSLVIAGVGAWVIVNSVGRTGVRVVDYGVPACSVFLASVCGGSGAMRIDRPLLRWLGDVSYSMYLVHPFVVVVAGLIMRRIGLFDNGHGVWTAAFMVLSSVAGAGLLYRYVERPITTFARRVLLPRRA